MRPYLPLGQNALALRRTKRPNSVAIVRDAATSAAAETTRRASQNRRRQETTWVIPVRLQLSCPDDAGTSSHRRRRSRGLSARGIVAAAWFWRAHRPDQRRGAPAVPTPAFVKGLSERCGRFGCPDVPAGQILSRAEHRLDCRSCRFDRSRGTPAIARIRLVARL